jgi:hypothetical protein
MKRSIVPSVSCASRRVTWPFRKTVDLLGGCLVLCMIAHLLPLTVSGQVMFSENYRMVARGTTLTTKTIDGVKKHILVVPPGKLEEPLTIKGTESKEERIVLKDDEKTKAFIAAAEKEPSNTTFAVILELNGSSGSYTGSVTEFQKETKKQSPI